MELKTFFARNNSGDVLASPTVTVYLAGTVTLATGLQDAAGAALTNPFTGGSNGKVEFRADNGKYDLLVTSGATSVTIDELNFVDAETVIPITLLTDNTLGRFGFGPDQNSEFAQYTTAFGDRAALNATSTESDGSDRATATPGNTGLVEKADYGTFVGHSAGEDAKGHAMTLMGNLAGYGSAGYVTTAIGQKAFYEATGTHFTGIGYRSGEHLTGDYCGAIGYLSLDTAISDETVAAGAFAGRFLYGNYNVFYGDASGENGLLTNSVGLGRNSLRYSSGSEVAAVGGDNFAGVEVTANNFTITTFDIPGNRVSIPAGTAATNGWVDGENILLKWDGTNLVNKPTGLGGVLTYYRFILDIDGADEWITPVGTTLVSTGTISGFVTATPIAAVTNGVVLGNGYDITADNAGGILADASEANAIRVGQKIRALGGLQFTSGDVLSAYTAWADYATMPTITSDGTPPSVTHSIQEARYSRIGNTYHCSVRLRTSAASGGTGNIVIENALPALPASSRYVQVMCRGWASNENPQWMEITAGSTTVELHKYIGTDPNGTTTASVVADLSNGAAANDVYITYTFEGS